MLIKHKYHHALNFEAFACHFKQSKEDISIM